MSNTFLKLCLKSILLLSSLIIINSCDQKNKSPNIVIIFTDDQGYGDLGCYGATKFETPNIDSMAKEGLLFTDFYVSQAVCSASRASLMTGSYAERVGVQGALSPWAVDGLNPKIQTIAKLLKAHNYTTAIFGKWHLGHRKEYLPIQNGFDEYAGLICSNDMWPVGYDGEPIQSSKKVTILLCLFGRGIGLFMISKTSRISLSLLQQSLKEPLILSIGTKRNHSFFIYRTQCRINR